MNPDPVISVVVPCFNEAPVISACYERLTQVLAGTGESYEIVFVDDGSTDETALLLCGIRDRDPHVVVLRLSRNFGQSAATSAGLDAALGQAVVTIDADLQDPPELISEMLGLWRQGYQLVYGIRETRFGETWFKVMSSRLFNGLLSRLANVYIAPNSGEFRLMDRCVVQAIRRMPERHRMLRGMAAWVGFRQAGLHYQGQPRLAGNTKYPLKKLLGIAADGIVSFSIMPLRLVTAIGFLSAGGAFLGIVYSLFVRLLTHAWVREWVMLLMGMLFMSGVQLLCLGILGEYIGRIHTESKQRPLYLLDERPRGRIKDEQTREASKYYS